MYDFVHSLGCVALRSPTCACLQKSNLNNHVRDKHEENVPTYGCTQEGCLFQAKQKGNLKVRAGVVRAASEENIVQCSAFRAARSEQRVLNSDF